MVSGALGVHERQVDPNPTIPRKTGQEPGEEEEDTGIENAPAVRQLETERERERARELARLRALSLPPAPVLARLLAFY